MNQAGSWGQDDSVLRMLLEQALHRFVRPDARLEFFATLPMSTHAGMSGATLSRYRVVYAASGDCDTIHVITKRASLRERRVLTLLTEQHQAVPWCYTLDLTTDTPPRLSE